MYWINKEKARSFEQVKAPSPPFATTGNDEKAIIAEVISITAEEKQFSFAVIFLSPALIYAIIVREK